MKTLYPTPKLVRLDIPVGFKNRKKPGTELHELLGDWMGPDFTYQGHTHFYKFYTPSALAKREAEKARNGAKRQRWKDEKKYFKSFRAWAMFDRARSEGKGGFEKGNRIWFGGGANRKRRPRGWVKKQKGAKDDAGTETVDVPSGPAASVDAGPVATAEVAETPVATASTTPNSASGTSGGLPPASKKVAGKKAKGGKQKCNGGTQGAVMTEKLG